jgi:hypothetical protein
LPEISRIVWLISSLARVTFHCAAFQISKRAAAEATKFSRGGVELVAGFPRAAGDEPYHTNAADMFRQVGA